EAGRHATVLDVAPGAAGRVRTLLREDPIEVAVIRARLVARLLLGVAFGRRLREQGPERARMLRIVPVEAGPLAGGAADLLREVVLELRVLALRVDVDAADVDGLELVPADAPVQDLVVAGLRVEAPPTIDLHERDGKRPVVRAEMRDRLARRQRLDAR